jgi:hypothetical protein
MIELRRRAGRGSSFALIDQNGVVLCLLKPGPINAQLTNSGSERPDFQIVAPMIWHDR